MFHPRDAKFCDRGGNDRQGVILFGLLLRHMGIGLILILTIPVLIEMLDRICLYGSMFNEPDRIYAPLYAYIA